MLAVIGGEPDTWGPLPPDILAERLAHVPRVERAVVADAGHFMHIEQPRRTAELILDFLER
jgi:pimeloyl-ACP methyl ester carboxylesterase